MKANDIIFSSVSLCLLHATAATAQTYSHDPLKYQQIEAMELGSGSLSDPLYILHGSYRNWANANAKSLFRLETYGMDKLQLDDALITDSVFQNRAKTESALMADRMVNTSGMFESNKLQSLLQSLKDKKLRLDVLMPGTEMTRRWANEIAMYETAMRSLDSYNPNSERQLRYEKEIYARMLRSNQLLGEAVSAQESRARADAVLRGSAELSSPSKKKFARSAILRWREHAWQASASAKDAHQKRTTKSK